MAGSPTKVASPVKKASPKKRAKKPSKPRAHPPTREMVRTAIANLKDRKGSSLQAIKNYIASNYRVDMARMNPHIKASIKAQVSSGVLKQVKGQGAAGRFRLGAVPKKVAKKRTRKTKAKKPKKTKKVRKTKAKKVTKKPKAKKAAKKPKAAKPKKPKVAKKAAAKPKKVKAKVAAKPKVKKTTKAKK